MFKKLREKLYDRQTKKNLENMQFDTFAYYSDSPVPAFQKVLSKNKKGDEVTVFLPKTENSFKMAFNKLKNRYFKKVPYIAMKNNVKNYCEYFNFSEETLNYCVETFKNKKLSLTKSNNNI